MRDTRMLDVIRYDTHRDNKTLPRINMTHSCIYLTFAMQVQVYWMRVHRATYFLETLYFVYEVW